MPIYFWVILFDKNDRVAQIGWSMDWTSEGLILPLGLLLTGCTPSVSEAKSFSLSEAVLLCYKVNGLYDFLLVS